MPPFFAGDIIFILPPINVDVSSMYGCSIDGMDKMCDGHPWCTTKITNIINDFGLSFRRSSYASYLQCINTYYDYMYHNGSVYNYSEWIGSTHIPFSVGDVAPKKLRLECKVCRLTSIYIVLYHVPIIYVHCCEAKPTTLKRPSPDDGFENHMSYNDN